MIKITLPQDTGKFKKLKTGQEVLLSGTIYSLRDKAHAKLVSSGQMPEEMV